MEYLESQDSANSEKLKFRSISGATIYSAILLLDHVYKKVDKLNYEAIFHVTSQLQGYLGGTRILPVGTLIFRKDKGILQTDLNLETWIGNA